MRLDLAGYEPFCCYPRQSAGGLITQYPISEAIARRREWHTPSFLMDLWRRTVPLCADRGIATLRGLTREIGG